MKGLHVLEWIGVWMLLGCGSALAAGETEVAGVGFASPQPPVETRPHPARMPPLRSTTPEISHELLVPPPSDR